MTAASTNPSLLCVVQDSWSEPFGQPRGLLKLEETTLLEEVVRRLRSMAVVERIAFTTSTEEQDDEIARHAASLGLEVFRGERRNVLSRVLLPVEKYQPEHVVRAFGSQPFLDTDNLSRMIAHHLEHDADLTTCEHGGSIVRGMGAEVVRADALRLIDAEELTRFQREFHTQYIKMNEQRFKVERFASAMPRPTYSLSVGTRQDYILANEIYRRLDGCVDERRVVELLDAEPHLVEINSRNGGGEIGLEKILLFPEKVGSIGRVSDGVAAVDPSYPVSVELSLTDACQLKCIWCSDADLRQREFSTMPRETVMALLDDLKAHGTRGVVIEGGGEPTLYPHLGEVVEHAKSLGLSLGLISNGVRRIDDEVARAFDWVRVSLDASTPEEFLALKGLDAFNDVIENISRFVRLVPVAGVGYVLTNRNYRNLENLVFLLQKIGVSYLHIRPVIDHDELRLAQDMRYLKHFTYQQFPILTDALKENAPSGNLGLTCVAHSLTSVIASSGNVYICGRLNIHDWLKPIGNVNQTGFKEIWTGEERASQARQLTDGTFCQQHCPQCRMTKYNNLFDKQRGMKTRDFI